MRSALERATPDQIAAIKLILRCGPEVPDEKPVADPATPEPAGTPLAESLAALHRELAGVRTELRELRKARQENPLSEAASDSEAVRVFALMKSLDDGDRSCKAPLGRVFRMLVLEGLSQKAVAVKCDCAPSLITLRVAQIERRMSLPLLRLRLLASRLGDLDSSAHQDPRARSIYQRGLTDDTGSEGK